MRSLRLAGLACAIAAFAVACNSNGEEPSNVTGGDAGNAFETTGANGQFEYRDQACATYVGALRTRATALGCTLSPDPSCPAVLDDFERTAFPPGTCIVGYDEGALANCLARISSYTQCTDFATKRCVLVVKQDPTKAACSGDAGAVDASAASDSNVGGG
jgi:hypothetical protein